MALAIGTTFSVPAWVRCGVSAVQPWKVRNMEQTAGEAISRTSVRPSAAKGSYCCQLPENT
ncbi:hypothetical protein D3C78_1888030 [compost metagenome]